MTLMVAPAALIAAAECPSEWKENDGTPKRLEIRFLEGVAEVPDNLGRWLIDQGYANRTSLKRVVRKLIH